ncbi:hypothetical protein REH65_20895 [Saccharopolyspora sp. ID03-671]|uniref:hypothetical protein n=1 Tax=Saccharopolyspora sp. ID03-671 TaxID=3073066 RepID=UPI0032557786
MVRGPVPVLHRPGVVGDVIRALMVKDPAQRLPLTEVRRRLQHLLPEPGARPFAMLLDPDSPTVRVRQRVLQQHSSHQQSQPSVPPAPQLTGSAPLAADPGPPPFTLHDPPKPRRRPLRTVALVMAALVLFAGAMVGSFVATRLLVGAPLVPGRGTEQPTTPAVSLPPLVPNQQDAKHSSAPSGGEFTISAPSGWRPFQSERNDLANNSVVAFISGDGTTEVAVQRYGDYFADGGTMDDYEAKAGSTLGGPTSSVKLSRPFHGEGDTRRVSYVTRAHQLLTGPAKEITRHSEASLQRSGDDLWIIRVTGAADQAEMARALLDRVVPTFKPGT